MRLSAVMDKNLYSCFREGPYTRLSLFHQQLFRKMWSGYDLATVGWIQEIGISCNRAMKNDPVRLRRL